MATMKPPAVYTQLFVALVVLYLHQTLGIPLEQFYPYGEDSGDDDLPPHDDGSSSAITLTIPFPFFDEEKHTVFVSKMRVCLCSYSIRVARRINSK